MLNPRLPVFVLLAAIAGAVLSPRIALAEHLRSERQAGFDYPVWILYDSEKELKWEDWKQADWEQILRDYEALLTEKIQASEAAREAETDTESEPLFPKGAVFHELGGENGIVLAKILAPEEALSGFSGEEREALAEWLLKQIEGDGRLRSFRLLAKPPEAEQKELEEREEDPYANEEEPDYETLGYYIRLRPPFADKPVTEETKDLAAEDAVTTKPEGPEFRAQPQGALTGASVFVNPGHGWLWSGNPEDWRTQRGVSHGLIEDHSNAEAVLQYLVPYLWNAGARVYTTRERDLNPNSVIVDNGSPGCTRVGDWTEMKTAGAYGGAQHLAATSAGGATAAAIYTPNIPEEGYYGVYVWYTPAAGGQTARDARFEIRHTGGLTTWVQDQRRDGYTWKYIGTYYFEAGADAARGSVTITSESAEEGRQVVADAVRFGGGMGTHVPEEGTISGKPRWEESGMYYTEIMGLDPEGDDRSFNSVSAMPRLAEWEMEPWEKDRSIYLAWHTNASARGESRGMSSFVYGPNTWGPLSDFSGYPGSVELMHHVHDEVMNDVHAAIDPEWADAGKITRWLGETNPRYNKKMPAALFEYGFHDNAEDAALILTPQFRRTAARATYQGIVKYFANEVEGFENATLLPEPPTHFHVRSLSGGTVELAWYAPESVDEDGLLGDPATGYRVYRSSNGKGFDNGTAAAGTSMIVEELPAGEVVYFRVTATNAGGESLPSETLAVRRPAYGTARVLVVNGFDRLDRGQNIRKLDEKSGRVWERGILAKMNSYDYVIQHGEAVAAAGETFDSTSNEAVEEGLVELGAYEAVVWILGEEAGETEVFSESEKGLVAAYLQGGGSMFVSGAEAALELDRRASEEDPGRIFFRQTLRAQYQEDDADSYTVSGAPGSIFEGLSGLRFDDGSGATYHVDAPDIVQPLEGARAALLYVQNGPKKELPAAIQYAGEYRLVYLGFPFETLVDENDRAALMSRALGFLLSR